MRLETDRLIFRPLSQDDVEPLLILWADPVVTKYLGGPRDRNKTRPLIEEDIGLSDPCLLQPVFIKKSGEFVGHFGLLEKEIDGRNEHDFVYVVAKENWGQGYATEMARALIGYAKTELQLKRLVAVIEPENADSARVAKKLGFDLEASVERDEGVFKDLYSISL